MARRPPKNPLHLQSHNHDQHRYHMRFLTPLLSLFIGAFIAHSQTTVVYDTTSILGRPSNKTITVTPAQESWTWNGHIVSADVVMVYPVGGLGTNSLIPGDYYLQIDGLTKSWKLPVPDTNVTVRADVLIRSLPSYVENLDTAWSNLTNRMLSATNPVAVGKLLLKDTNGNTFAALNTNGGFLAGGDIM